MIKPMTRRSSKPIWPFAILDETLVLPILSDCNFPRPILSLQATMFPRVKKMMNIMKRENNDEDKKGTASKKFRYLMEKPPPGRLKEITNIISPTIIMGKDATTEDAALISTPQLSNQSVSSTQSDTNDVELGSEANPEIDDKNSPTMPEEPLAGPLKDIISTTSGSIINAMTEDETLLNSRSHFSNVESKITITDDVAPGSAATSHTVPEEPPPDLLEDIISMTSGSIFNANIEEAAPLNPSSQCSNETVSRIPIIDISGVDIGSGANFSEMDEDDHLASLMKAGDIAPHQLDILSCNGCPNDNDLEFGEPSSSLSTTSSRSPSPLKYDILNTVDEAQSTSVNGEGPESQVAGPSSVSPKNGGYLTRTCPCPETAEDSCEDECFSNDHDPDFAPPSSSSSTNPSRSTSPVNKPPPTRRRKSQPSEWKDNQRKRMRAACLPYVSKTGKKQGAKIPKPFPCVEKCRFKCRSKFTELQRQKFCQMYHAMDFEAQRRFLLSSVQVSNIQRKSAPEGSGKSAARQFYLTAGGARKRVCKKFFTETLCISHGPIDTALQNQDFDNHTFSGSDKRGHKEPGNKTKDDVKAFVLTHIDSFSTHESHYCRRRSQRKYLDATLSISKMYQLFISFAKDDLVLRMTAWNEERQRKDVEIENEDDVPELKMVSESTYRRIFCVERNLSFFKPKKDQCLQCSSYLNASPEEQEQLRESYEEHLQRKEEANEAKNIDKERANQSPEFVTATFDLQSVLQIPSSDVSQMYYSRKLNAFNLTIYEGAKPNNAYCFVWTEINGARGSSEIGTALMFWLKGLPQTAKHVSLFSDTCGGQNRNQHVASLLLYLTNTLPNIQTMEHKFLESGHSHMEADSMHSAIESAKKYVPVYSIHDWLNIMRMARSTRNNKKVTPYEVKELTYQDFVDLKKLSASLILNRVIDSEGGKINWLKIKRLKYEKNQPGVIFFSYSFEGEYNELRVSWTKKIGEVPQKIPEKLTPLYKKPIPITEVKKKDLVKLCTTLAIPREFHEWYNKLPSTKKKTVERLPEPSFSETEDEDAE